MSVVGASAEGQEPYQGQAADPPWRRAVRQLLRKRVAVVALVVIGIIYGAGTWTVLDLVGIPTGLQDPNQTNLTLRRPAREGESLGAFLERHDAPLERVRSLNPDLVAEFGPLSERTQLPDGTQVVLRGDEALQGPSWDHLFGTDRNGRDLFSRAFFAARTTLIVTALSFLFGNIFLGLGLGLLAGYKGGWVDAVIMRVGDIILALPGLLILIVVNAAFRDRWSNWFREIDDFLGTTFLVEQGIDDFSLIFFALSLFGWVETARFLRAQTLALREEEFVLAAESMGAGTNRIIWRHLFPSVLPWIVVGISAALGAVAGAEVVLTFIGVGIEPPTASFGAMISEAGGPRTFSLHPHMLLVPGATIMLLLLAFNLLGDALNDIINPRGR